MAQWKGLILAGGTGSRLFPLTLSVNKYLLPVYDKPMIYYPLTTLMLGGIRDFVIVSLPEMLPQFQTLFGTGEQWGLHFEYVAQPEAKGIAHGFHVAARQLKGCHIAMILGDNIFYGTGLPAQLIKATKQHEGATIFGYEVNDPSSFGVVEFDDQGAPVSLVEKPQYPTTGLAVPGLYFYDTQVLDIAQNIEPSARGELEITDVNKVYLAQKQLTVLPIGRGTAWLDGGTHSDLFEASQFVKVMEDRTGLKVSCPEEVAFRMNYITASQLESLIPKQPKTGYDVYLRQLAERNL